MLTRRQIENRMLRDMGEKPVETYHWLIDQGDEVIVHLVEQTGWSGRIQAKVMDVDVLGDAKELTLEPVAGGQPITVRIFEQGPPDWGVIECVVVAKGRTAKKLKRDPAPVVDSDDILLPPHEPRRCPECGRMVYRQPRAGWPCLCCRRRGDALANETLANGDMNDD